MRITDNSTWVNDSTGKIQVWNWLHNNLGQCFILKNELFAFYFFHFPQINGLDIFEIQILYYLTLMLSHTHLFLNIFFLICIYFMITNIFFFFLFLFCQFIFHQVCLVMNIYVTTLCFVFRKKKARALCYMSLRNHQQNILYHHVIRQWKGYNLSKITVETND